VKRNGKGWLALCPSHDDHRPSLSVKDGDNGCVLLHCFAGCSLEQVCAALGLDPHSLRTNGARSYRQPMGELEHEPRRIMAIYDYRDEQGILLYQVVRYKPKGFAQRRPDGKGGHIWNMDGVGGGLYRLPDLLASDINETVFGCEGEKDTDETRSIGLVATCNVGGAGNWSGDYNRYLRSRRLVLLPHNDEPGRKHADQEAASIHGTARSIKIVRLDGLSEKGDISDWIQKRRAAGVNDAEIRAELERIVEATAEWMPQSAGVTPARWFEQKFPSLATEFGEAILEQANKQGNLVARNFCEDFLAATLGEKASPDAPTVFISTESRFYTYSSKEGVFIHQRDAVLQARLSRLLLECARACRGGIDTRPLEFRLRNSANLSGVIRKARGLLEAPHDFFSSDLTEFVPCANGMLRLSDKALLPFSPSYRRRNKLGVPFDAIATCPLFLETLMRPALDQDELDLLQRWCGLALIGENRAQKIVILPGTSGGGKGTFVRVLGGVIGSTNLASLRPQLLGERFELGRFLGKTLLYGADVPENFLNQRGASVLKSLTGGDPVTLEFKNSNESPLIICRFNVIVTCNSRLTVHLEGDTEAWRRRLVIIDYNKPKPECVIENLDQQILTTEAPGVLNWMLEGLYKLRDDDWQLHPTSSQQALVDNLLLESNGHAWFVKNELVRAERSQLTVAECFAAYVEYCSERGWVAQARNKFSQLIGDIVARQHGITVRHDILDANGKDQRGWRGLKLRGSSRTD
jgi:P4 family phage/plasmid primase-like protien